MAVPCTPGDLVGEARDTRTISLLHGRSRRTDEPEDQGGRVARIRELLERFEPATPALVVELG